MSTKLLSRLYILSFPVNISMSLLVLVLQSACAITQERPEHWSSPAMAFPNAISMTPPKGKSVASQTAIFQASFEDVYRATMVSATQAMFDVTDENKDKGYILAQRIPQYSKPGEGVQHYYYAIKVNELGAKKTRVIIIVKAQMHCVLPTGTAKVLTLGIISGVNSATGAEKDCLEKSEVHWVSNDDSTGSAKADMSQLMIFIRNNLIAAGLY